MTIGYGLTSKEQALDIAACVVNVLGGGQNAYKLIVETAYQETKLGMYKDRTDYAAGNGLCQCDHMPFRDTQARTSAKNKALILEAFDIDVDQVQWRELAYSPLLAMLWCRMHYLLRPGAIPETVEGRADYWKREYNSMLGKGTVNEYVHNAGLLGNIC